MEDIFAEVLGGIVLSVGDVVLSVGEECSLFVGCERADDLCRYAKCEDTGRDGFAFGHHGAGADDAVRADGCAIQNNGTYADQALILDCAAVKTHTVADGDMVTYLAGESVVYM